MPNNKKRGRAKRRRRDGPHFIQLFRYVLDSAAYVSLSLAARCALIELNRGFNGGNNGKIVLSERALAERMGCHRDTVRRALHELTDKGFIEARVKGAFAVKFRRATEWRLNDRRCDATGQAQSQAFLSWSGNPEQNRLGGRQQNLEHGPKRCARTGPNGVPLEELRPRLHGPKR